jgi:hypothetical protein
MRKTVISFALTALFYALCASAEAQEPAKVPRIGYLAAASLSANRRALKHSGRVCAILVMSREKTSSLSGDMQRDNSTGYPISPPN